jgi:N-acetylmuramoyl-L-alanine amidase
VSNNYWDKKGENRLKKCWRYITKPSICQFVYRSNLIEGVIVLKICIDPGHGGKSPGAAGRYSYEKNINLSIALKVEDRLIKRGIVVVMTRRDDAFLGLQERCDIANKNKCDYFLSIHCNSFEDEDVKGLETFYYNGSKEGYNFGIAVQNGAESYSKFKDRGVKAEGFYVLRKTLMPAVLLETGFMSNRDEEDTLNNSSWQDGFADALSSAIADFLGAGEPVDNTFSGLLYRVFSDDVQRGAFRVKDNAVKMLNDLLSGKESGSVGITITKGVQ